MIDLSKSNKKLTALGINVGGGGFTIGAMKNFKILDQWEEQGIIGAKTFNLNFKGIDHPLSLDIWPVKQYINKVDFIFANPPCTPWSISTGLVGATKENRHLDNRLDLSMHTMEVAQKIKPKVFICESVENAYNIGRESYYSQYAKQWINLGYSVTYFLNDAIIQGTPHVRRRFHFIAHKYKLSIPENPGKFKVVSVSDSIRSLSKINPEISQHTEVRANPILTESFKFIKPYELLRVGHLRMTDYKGPKQNFFARKLAWDFPGPTLVTFTYAHPDQNRMITIREGLKLCGYPDWYFTLKPIDAVDAVMPPVAEFLSKIAKESIDKKEYVSKDLKVIDWRPFAKPYHANKKSASL